METTVIRSLPTVGPKVTEEAGGFSGRKLVSKNEAIREYMLQVAYSKVYNRPYVNQSWHNHLALVQFQRKLGCDVYRSLSELVWQVELQLDLHFPMEEK